MHNQEVIDALADLRRSNGSLMPEDVVEQRKVEDEEAKELQVAAEVKALEAPAIPPKEA